MHTKTCELFFLLVFLLFLIFWATRHTVQFSFDAKEGANNQLSLLHSCSASSLSFFCALSPSHVRLLITLFFSYSSSRSLRVLARTRQRHIRLAGVLPRLAACDAAHHAVLPVPLHVDRLLYGRLQGNGAELLHHVACRRVLEPVRRRPG